MDADQHAVLRDGEILLDEVGPLLDRQRYSRERVLGRIAGRAAVGHEDFRSLLHRRRGREARREREDEEGSGHEGVSQNVTFTPSCTCRAIVGRR